MARRSKYVDALGMGMAAAGSLRSPALQSVWAYYILRFTSHWIADVVETVGLARGAVRVAYFVVDIMRVLASVSLMFGMIYATYAACYAPSYATLGNCGIVYIPFLAGVLRVSFSSESR
jgi:hypothetical protein